MTEFIMTIITIAFVTLPLIFVLQYYKQEKAVNDYVAILKNNQDTNDILNDDLEINQDTNKKSILTISYYAIIFFIVSSIISIIILFGYLLINNISIESIQADEELYNQIIDKISPMVQFLVYVIAIAGVIIISSKIIISDLKTFRGKLFAMGAVGCALLYAANIVSNLIMILLGVNDNSANQDAIESMMQPGLPIILTFITTVILAPILEELVFRKSIFNLFPKKPYLALVVSSLCFGFMHVISTVITIIPSLLTGNATYLKFITELFYGIVYSLMGYALGYTYLKSNKNIIGPIFAHMLSNLLAFIISIYY